MPNQIVDIQAELETKGFHLWGNIQLVNAKLKFISISSGSISTDEQRGFVYAWVEVDPNDNYTKICYVGKAGKTLQDRWQQHEGGFQQSTTGRRHATNINAILAKSFTLQVWARYSPKEVVFGFQVSRCQIEETALIVGWRPSWNTLC